MGAVDPVDGNLLRWMRLNEDSSPGRYMAVACFTKYMGIGHLKVGLGTDLLNGQTIAATIVVLAVPNLALTCMFPYSDMNYECRCDLSVYRPIWPDTAAWKPMRNPGSPSPAGSRRSGPAGSAGGKDRTLSPAPLTMPRLSAPGGTI